MELMPIYLVMAASGIGLLVIMTLFDELAEMLDDAFDAVFNLDADDVGIRWVSGYSIIAFTGSFGLGGAGSLVMGASNFGSIVFALIVGLTGGGLAAAFMGWMRKQEKSSHVKSGMLVDLEAQVTLTIPENGIGEINVSLNESRRIPAQSADGAAISRGTTVVIVKEGNPVIVRIKN